MLNPNYRNIRISIYSNYKNLSIEKYNSELNEIIVEIRGTRGQQKKLYLTFDAISEPLIAKSICEIR